MNIGVIGSGSIGPDLAYGFVSALAKGEGGKVYLHDIKQDALDAGVERIRGYMGKGLSRGKLDPKVAKAIEAAFTGHRSCKHVFVVDKDIDIYDPLEVEWAMARRSVPRRNAKRTARRMIRRRT